MARKETVVGLDIGHYAVKAVWASQRGDELSIRRTETLHLPGASSESRGIIRAWIEKEGIARHPCILSLSGERSMFQPFTLPPGDPRTLEQAASMEVVRFNEMASENMVYGFCPIALVENEKRFLLAMSRQTFLDELLVMAGEARLNVVDIVPSPVAMYNGLLPLVEDTSRPSLFLDIGHVATGVAIGGDAGLMFARTFAGGGRMFTDALAKSRGISAAQAENIKLNQPVLLPGVDEDAGELRSVAEMWVSEIQSCLSVYGSLYPGEDLQPQRMVLAGGASRLTNFAEYAGNALGMETCMPDSLPGAREVTDPHLYYLAGGLARSGLGLADTPISVLPSEIRDELIFRKQKPFWIAAGIAAALILAVSFVGGFRDVRRKESQLSEQRASLRRRQQLVQEIERADARNAEILHMAGPVRSMLGTGPIMRELLTLVSESRASSDWITMVCDSESYFGKKIVEDTATRSRSTRGQPRIPKPTRPDEVQPLERILVEGYTQSPNLSTVRELITKLTAADFVKSADLLSDDKLKKDASGTVPPRAIRFMIDVEIAAQ